MKTMLTLVVLLAVRGVAAEPVRNVVLIISDDLRASVLGCYGDKVLRDPDAVVHDAAFSYNGAHHGLRSDRWAYMRYSDGSEELYDMDTDPNQYTNLANMPAHASVLETFRGQIQQRGKSIGEPPRRKKSRQ